jgi:hypothetical protein
MKPIAPLGLCAVASLVAFHAGAQTLAPGTWTGALKIAGASAIAVEYVVQSVGDSLAVTMKSARGPASPVTDLTIGERDLAFRWGGFSCALQQKGGNKYEGTCSTSDGTSGELTLTAPKATRPSPPVSTRRSRDLLTAEDLVATGASNLYDAIQKQHADWLRPRTPNSSIMFPPVVLVYLNGQPVGGVDFLRSIPVLGVATVEFYSASEATTRWGTSNTGGAISVTQRPPGP